MILESSKQKNSACFFQLAILACMCRKHSKKINLHGYFLYLVIFDVYRLLGSVGQVCLLINIFYSICRIFALISVAFDWTKSWQHGNIAFISNWCKHLAARHTAGWPQQQRRHHTAPSLLLHTQNSNIILVLLRVFDFLKFSLQCFQVSFILSQIVI